MRKRTKFSEKACSFERALLRESDRGCVLVAHAFVEEELGNVLRKHFVRVSGSPKESFDALLEGSLGTFAPRVRMARALGLIDNNMLATLLAVNDLRVHFAHYRGLVTLNTNVTEKLRQTLDTQERQNAQALGKYVYRWFARRAKTPMPKHSRARTLFVSIAAEVWSSLCTLSWTIEHRQGSSIQQTPASSPQGSTPQSL